MNLLDQWITNQEDTLWFRAVAGVIQVWVWLFIIMFLGYITLSFFGVLDTLPTHQPIPGILGDPVVTTTQPTTRL